MPRNHIRWPFFPSLPHLPSPPPSTPIFPPPHHHPPPFHHPVALSPPPAPASMTARDQRAANRSAGSLSAPPTTHSKSTSRKRQQSNANESASKRRKPADDANDDDDDDAADVKEANEGRKGGKKGRKGEKTAGERKKGPGVVAAPHDDTMPSCVASKRMARERDDVEEEEREERGTGGAYPRATHATRCRGSRVSPRPVGTQIRMHGRMTTAERQQHPEGVATSRPCLTADPKHNVDAARAREDEDNGHRQVTTPRVPKPAASYERPRNTTPTTDSGGTTIPLPIPRHRRSLQPHDSHNEPQRPRAAGSRGR
ncbi:hypothetical protein BDZ97DRAFT_1926705 [Flammula alnicola]|nr:hypothetical protein BDZ97DRAFT_1926705 [Flammula alnicola]